jgi:hypothetical protein
VATNLICPLRPILLPIAMAIPKVIVDKLDKDLLIA